MSNKKSKGLELKTVKVSKGTWDFLWRAKHEYGKRNMDETIWHLIHKKNTPKRFSRAK